MDCVEYLDKFGEQYYLNRGFPGGACGKEPNCQGRRRKRHDFDPWIGKIPWRGVCVYVCVLDAYSCPALCNPVECDPPGSSVLGILQARILEWVAFLGDLPNPGTEPGSPT